MKCPSCYNELERTSVFAPFKDLQGVIQKVIPVTIYTCKNKDCDKNYHPFGQELHTEKPVELGHIDTKEN
jgi:hypothetical protein